MGFVSTQPILRAACFAHPRYGLAPALASAIPDRANRRLRVAGTEAAAVPAVVIERGPRRAIAVVERPVRQVIARRARSLDLLGRTIAGEEAVAVPVARGVVVLRRWRLRGRRRRH
jgi:hypothetical protein